MKNFTRHLILSLTLLLLLSRQHAQAQSVMNPADPVVSYNPASPPMQPVWGEIGKWVRTPLITDWNTDSYKAYIYKGTPFRLHFPKTYVPGAADGKKYPLLVFFHGLGEADSNIYHNEWQLKLGHWFFDNRISSGEYDGYTLSIQSAGSFGPVEFDKIREIIDYMIANNKLDPFQIATNGLSAGGQGAWEMAIAYPNHISAALPMSWASTYYTDPSVMSKLRSTPIWVFHGGLDGNPAPYTVYQIRDAYAAAGANFLNTEYPDAYHDTWNRAWGEPDFFGFINRSYKSNPWPLNGRFDFWPGETVNATLTLTPGFQAYEWRKDGALISGATGNTLNVTSFGTYTARVQRGGIWSDWSRIPVVVKQKTFTVIPAKIEAEAWSYMNGVKAENTSDAGGGQNVGYIDFRDWMDYNLSVPTAGTYVLKLRVATPQQNGMLEVRASNGSVLATLNLPVTGDWQTWQTVLVPVTLPAGYQTLRLISTGAAGWNLNWLDFVTSAPGNTAPTANAGPDKSITLPTDSVLISGSATDPDGSVVAYTWMQVSGPAVANIGSSNSQTTWLRGLKQGTYVFRFYATDNGNGVGADEVSVIVNPAPYNPNFIEAENWTAMSGVQTEATTDAGGGQNVGYIDGGDWMEYKIYPPVSGTYTLRFRISSPVNTGKFEVRNADGTVLATVTVPATGGWQSWQTITVPVTLTAGQQIMRLQVINGSWNINWLELVTSGSSQNAAPVANAGADQTITLPTNTATLSGSATDSDGTIASVAWMQVSGPSTAIIQTPSALQTAVSGLVQGTYTFRLTATDNAGGLGSDDVVITVMAATPPPASSNVIEAENWSAMSGVQTETTSDVGGGLNVGYIDNGDWMEYTINPSASGSYLFSFRVGSEQSGGQFQVRRSNGTVLATVNVPNTGGWQNWTTVTATISLSAGPQTLRLVSTATANWNINWFKYAPSTGNPSNQPPVANAGPDKSITLPTNSVSLAGSGTDSDGTIAAYNWAQVSGPSQATFSTLTSASTTVSNLTQGSYTFRLTVTDNSGATASDDVVVTVNGSTPPPSNSVRIQAENWSAMSGVQTETTSDVGGGLNVGYIDNGDWMEYTINPSASGTYTVNIRIASQWSGGQFQIRRSNGTVLATVNVPNTGGWQTWTTISTTISLTAGVQTVRFVSMNTSSWNINWWEYALVNGLQGSDNTGATLGRSPEGASVFNSPVAATVSAGVSLSPNPVQDQLRLQVGNAYRGALDVQIVGMNGVVYRRFGLQKGSDLHQQTLSLAGLPRGQYQVVLQMKDWRETQRILKQ